MRIGWSRAEAPDWARPAKGDQANAPPGVWIKLDDSSAQGGVGQVESTMAAFLDEGARDVYERSPWRDDEDDEDRDPASPNDEPAPKRPRFRWLAEHSMAVRDRHGRAALLLLDRLPTFDNGRAMSALRPNTYVIGSRSAPSSSSRARPPKPPPADRRRSRDRADLAGPHTPTGPARSRRGEFVRRAMASHASQSRAQHIRRDTVSPDEHDLRGCSGAGPARRG